MGTLGTSAHADQIEAPRQKISQEAIAALMKKGGTIPTMRDMEKLLPKAPAYKKALRDFARADKSTLPELKEALREALHFGTKTGT